MDNLNKINTFAKQHNCIIGICDALPLENVQLKNAKKPPFVTPNLEKRINPLLSLPTAKSVIVLGKSYSPSPYKNLSSLGNGTDYHNTIKTLLQKLAKLLACQNVIMVDSGVLAERPFAIKAGLGFWGRNNMVISPKLGSFFNIGLLLVDILLPPTETQQSADNLQCPTDCNICMKSCPAGAITPYFVNFEKCVSYITQKKGLLNLRETILLQKSQQLYGCDICQNCCPFNDFSQQQTEYNTAEILQMQQEEFTKKFGDTALAWRGLSHLQRNAKLITRKEENY
ncbi:MAG: DUF1730 domain-containing protein [Firmicutes bacterium]|nr:DUF1730 domain-containing protein [Bacillota bacterium]